MISIDKKIAQTNSKSQKRMEDYGSIVDELHIVVLTPFVLGGSNTIKIGNVFIYPTNNRFKIFYFLKALLIGRNIIKKFKFSNNSDLITTQDSFPTGIVGYCLKIIYGLPLQIQVHINFFNPFFLRESILNKIYFLCAGFLLPRVNNIRVVSCEIRDYLIEKLKINSDKISVLPVFANFNFINQYSAKINLHDKYPQFNFIILMPTRLVRQKNIKMAMCAMHKLVKKYPQIGLVMPSTGPEEKNLKELSRALKLENNIIFESWDCDLFSYYKTADLFLLTSNYEGWALTVTEAMASSLPVISTKVGCANEIIKDGHNGLLVSLNDSEELYKAIEKLYLNLDLCKNIAKNGYESIKNLHPVTKEEYLNKYLDGFKKTLYVKPLWKTMPLAIKKFNLSYSLPNNLLPALPIMAGFRKNKDNGKPTVLICSISEDYVKLWLYFASKFLNNKDWNFLVVDGAGDIDSKILNNDLSVKVIKFLNIYHGQKVDIVLRKIINSNLVFLCDDDKYIISDINPALNLLSDDKIKAVSLCHRTWYKNLINNREYWPMGSYALLFNRKFFIENQIKIKSRRHLKTKNRIFLNNAKSNFGYDTSDYANEQILSMGYNIPTYPEGKYVLGFNNMSGCRILLMYYGVNYIKQVLLQAKHFEGINGSIINSLYCRSHFEKLFYDAFNKTPKLVSGFNMGDLIDIVNNNRNITQEQKEKILFCFQSIDSTYKKLNQLIKTGA